MSKEEIYTRVFTYLTEKEFWKYCLFSIYNLHYKPFNCALILAQRPGATFVQTEYAWNREGFCLKPEAVPIIVLQPNGPVGIAYDREDVYLAQGGNDDPISMRIAKSEYEFFKEHPEKKHTFSEEKIASWQNAIQRRGIRVAYVRLGERMKGTAQQLPAPMQISYTEEDEKGELQTKFVEAFHQININPSEDAHHQGLTLLHELGHLYCGHIGGNRTKANKLPVYGPETIDSLQSLFTTELNKNEQKMLKIAEELTRKRNVLSEDEKKKQEEILSDLKKREKVLIEEAQDLETALENTVEYEAELVCKILCDRKMFFNDRSDEYMRNHTRDGVLPLINIYRVMNAVEKIADILNI